MSHILEALVNASERAANIARACCERSPEEGALLVAEKCGGDANARFDHDFKTIADVLAQEAAKTEIGKRCPSLYQNVRGEECSEIDGVSVNLKDDVEATTEMLCQIVPFSAASRMAEAAHSEPNLTINLQVELSSLNAEDLGVWIDPIDATSEFIAGVRGDADAGFGLPCVTVLIGAYLRSTGEPVMGVINQPFYNDGQGRIIWGLCHDGVSKWSGTDIPTPDESQTVLMSSSEKPDVVMKFEEAGWKINTFAGAGHKLMKVALGEAAAYIVSQGTTFLWDTCAPHAILKAKGGDILSYTTHEPIKYNIPISHDIQVYCNSEGILSFNESSTLDEIKSITL